MKIEHYKVKKKNHILPSKLSLNYARTPIRGGDFMLKRRNRNNLLYNLMKKKFSISVEYLYEELEKTNDQNKKEWLVNIYNSVLNERLQKDLAEKKMLREKNAKQKKL